MGTEMELMPNLQQRQVEAELLLYKNRLQEYTQKASLSSPLYQTTNTGSQHSPKFRSSVMVDGVMYASPNSFSNRKAAEQDVARLALESLSTKMKDEGCSIMAKEIRFCKSILNEYAAKLNFGVPAYHTTQLQIQPLPRFVSSLEFRGVNYTGEPSKNKKEAEQLAARSVISSLLGDPEQRTLVFVIIKSKEKLFDSVQNVEDPNHAKAVIPKDSILAGGCDSEATNCVLMCSSDGTHSLAGGKVDGMPTEAVPRPSLGHDSLHEFKSLSKDLVSEPHMLTISSVPSHEEPSPSRSVAQGKRSSEGCKKDKKKARKLTK